MKAEEQKPVEAIPQLLLDGQLCFPLYAAARKVVNRYTPYLKPFGITYTQYIVLLALWEAEHATVGWLCSRLYLDNGTITPLLKKMEESGLVIRNRSKQDERVVTIKDVPFQVGGCVPLEQEEAYTLFQLLHKLLEAME